MNKVFISCAVTGSGDTASKHPDLPKTPEQIANAAIEAAKAGAAGAVLQSFQHVSNRILVNADTILANKVKNLETTVKQLDAQQAIIKKLLKESVDGDKKALDSL